MAVGLDRVEPFVVSCFSIAPDDPRIVAFSRIGDVGRFASSFTRASCIFDTSTKAISCPRPAASSSI